ncbi:aspartate--tRNA ligase [Candidatus Sordicultor fermentans]|uniref:aspartate--tRNA ligase n=1 Tax=Candidatus Sordicultor fermentans TaxID=1953203 RepID=UPI0016A8AEDD|nr:aspartate--tRNA ligase [Atribacterota bacterium]NLY05043.1 aspartate--tRNA ligase [Candidatus Atribacteria bacterium]
MLRTHTCGELRKEDAGKEVQLTGWVSRLRDHGGILFIDLRDRWGITQLVVDNKEEIYTQASRVRPEYVIKVKGVVKERPEGLVNPRLSTGDVEIVVKDLEILSSSLLPPFEIEGNKETDESIRLRYRYLDLRRDKVQKNLILRHQVAQLIRRFLSEKEFLEVETPFLTKSTPEGARDFLVPSRLSPGHFYALPQSPQLFKQILMISGMDRYFQIVKCFRDEDLRADRQPEFTQVDIEMSFIEVEDIIQLIEAMMIYVFKESLGVAVDPPFPRLSYDEAMEKYGTDKPDLRIPWEIDDLTELLGQEITSFSRGGNNFAVKALFLPQGEDFSRKKLDVLSERAKENSLSLSWVKGGGSSPLKNKLSEETWQGMVNKYPFGENALLLLAWGERSNLLNFMGSLRFELGGEWIKDKKPFQFCWITDFPLVDWNEEENRWDSVHHPFTSPREEDLDFLDSHPEKVKSKTYDLVLNGYEIGSGSIRIHQMDLQRRIFNLLNLKEEEIEQKFGFFIEALQYGCPPHGGIALGFDRLIMLMSGESSIREVIAFPKTQKGVCLLTGAPAPVEEKQLEILGISLQKQKK